MRTRCFFLLLILFACFSTRGRSAGQKTASSPTRLAGSDSRNGLE